ncbi:conjugal transfer protein [uncultured Enterococcus sp.]|uniref:conjugal transfer protein n=1 Tax=uncultured Enterococcus sp. TaxID=167972 RepID=UPI002AA86984|nr:conjugal transfer protein [uncultured Enterococcus sp.]
MTVQLLLTASLFFLFIGYMSVVFILKQKKRSKQVQQRDENSVQTEAKLQEAIREWNEELFLEKGDRTSWYKLTFFFEKDEPKEYDFYSYNNTLTKEFILNDRFYVNDHELLIIDEAGEHYINRKNISQIDFLQRKILTAASKEEKEEEAPLSFKQDLSSAEQQVSVEIESTPSASSEAELGNGVKASKEMKQSSKFSKIKKTKRPSIKRMEAKTFNRLFLLVLLIILASGVLALIRTVVFDGRLVRLEAGQKAATENIEREAAVKDYPYELNLFMQTFIDQYMSLSNDSSQMDERAEKLNMFFSEEVSVEREISAVKRLLISSELAEVNDGEDFSTVYYKVIYSLEIPVEQSGELNGADTAETYVAYQTKEHTAFLAIDFIQKDNGFSIISPPYFTERKINHLEGTTIKKLEEASLAVNNEKLEDIRRFLVIFFEKYAGGSKEELSYLMADVESMGERYLLKEIESVDAYFSGEVIIVYTEVSFSEKESGVTHTEAFSVKLIEEANQFRASELVHNLGGF